MEKRTAWRIVNFLLTLVIVGFGIWAIFNRQDLFDWLRLRTYQPPAHIVQLADNTTMIGRGRELFFVSEPSVESSSTFNQHCTNQHEQSIVLGCYRAQQIYLFDVTDERLSGVEEVTAAHEMLHAAYERLSTDEKHEVNALLEPQIAALTDPRLLNLIKLYNQSEPGELYNEMHSILATEYRDLSPQLESYYKQYFADRKKIVSYSEKYEALFSASQTRIGELDAELMQLQQQIDSNNAALETQKQAIDNEAARLDALRQADTEAYNQAVPGYNTQIRDFNALVAQTQQLVDQFNTLVAERNREAAAQNDLYHQLDSRYQTVPQN